MTARLNVNIDHVATVRQARRAPEPSVVAAAMICEQAGADGITIHLRGDRRHIQDADVRLLRESVTTYLNVEMAATEEMMKVAIEIQPDAVSLVPENRALQERRIEAGAVELQEGLLRSSSVLPWSGGRVVYAAAFGPDPRNGPCCLSSNHI